MERGFFVAKCFLSWLKSGLCSCLMKILSTCLCIFLSWITLSSLAAEPKPASEFTTTDPKKVKILEDSALEKEPEIDHFKHLCPGFGGYEVIHEGGDLRSWINLKYQDVSTDLMSDTLAACPGQFPSKANHVVQWRGFRRGDDFVPYAIIYRMMSDREEGGKPYETLIIIKLAQDKSRVVAHVSATEGNERAEQLADQLCKP